MIVFFLFSGRNRHFKPGICYLISNKKLESFWQGPLERAPSHPVDSQCAFLVCLLVRASVPIYTDVFACVCMCVCGGCGPGRSLLEPCRRIFRGAAPTRLGGRLHLGRLTRGRHPHAGGVGLFGVTEIGGGCVWSRLASS